MFHEVNHVICSLNYVSMPRNTCIYTKC